MKATRTHRIDWGQVLDEVDRAVELFRDQGVKPTLRTLFYYLVSKEAIPNTRAAYKRLSAVLVKARKEGRYPWDFLEDRTRTTLGRLADNELDPKALGRFIRRAKDRIRSLDLDTIVNELIGYMAPSFSYGRWASQPIVVEVWVEKEALATTIYNWTEDLRVPIRVNRGYSSWTFIYNNVQELKRTLRGHDKVVVLYLGDLDPSGKDIERFLREAIAYFGLTEDVVELRRLAITEDQVEAYGLPPRPEDAETLAKLARDPRTKSYTGKYIVELDALVAYAAEDFKRLLREAINSYWDPEVEAKLRDLRDRLRAARDRAMKYLIRDLIDRLKDLMAEGDLSLS